MIPRPLAVLALAIVAAVLVPLPARAATCTVPGSHASIQQAENDPACDVIRVAAGRYAEDLVVNRPVTIVGAGAGKTIVDAEGSGRPLAITEPDTVVVRDLSLVNGNVAASHGGGVANEGTLTLRRVAILNNTAGASGGGLITWGGSTLRIFDSLVSGNTAASGNGGGVNIQGSATTTVVNTTITGNAATHDGGGVYVATTTATMRHSTVSNNTADSEADGTGNGGGVMVAAGAPAPTLNLEASIVAGNTDASAVGVAHDCSQGAGINSQGRNVIGDTVNCSYTAHPSDQTDVNARLRPLANNGGPTRTHAIRPGSPAMDLVPKAACGPGKDQRGAPRKGRCDAGAYELVLCRGTTVNRVGTPRRDVLTGTPGRDGFLALGGNDVARGLGGNDGMCLGRGDDRGVGGAGRDLILGQQGDDVLLGNRHNDVLLGQAGNDGLNGGPGRRDICRQGPGTGRILACEA